MRFALHLALVASFITCAGLQPAHAQYAANSGGSIKIKKDALEQVTWFKGRRHIQIVDESAVVSDLRRAKDNGVIEVNIPPAPKGSSAMSTIPAGGLKLPGAGTILVSLPALPSAGFGSNIPALGVAPSKSLPKGLSTNMLAGRLAAEQAALKPGSSQAPLVVAHQSRPTMVKSYGTYAPSAVTASASSSSTASVKGQLLQRRSLLDR